MKKNALSLFVILFIFLVILFLFHVEPKFMLIVKNLWIVTFFILMAYYVYCGIIYLQLKRQFYKILHDQEKIYLDYVFHRPYAQFTNPIVGFIGKKERIFQEKRNKILLGYNYCHGNKFIKLEKKLFFLEVVFLIMFIIII